MIEAFERAEEYDVMTTTYVAEISSSGTLGNRTAIDHLDAVGYLGERALLGHCVHITEADIRRLAATDTRVAHNLVTNLKLGSGIAALPTMQSAGISVGIGTDDSSANGTVDPPSDIKFAALVHRGHRQDATAVTAEDTLEMATVEAARAVGRHELGHLSPDTPVDLILVDLDQHHMLYTPIGLDLGGGEPYQIAMSIVSEVLAVHKGRTPGHLRDRTGPIHDRPGSGE
jgi:5-methylthioadenosine/S-adenosylhomocysteine deaminase